MRNIIIIVLLVVAGSVLYINRSIIFQNDINIIKDGSLVGTWENAYEENNGDGVITYRNENNYVAPPSRFRNSFIYKKPNRCQIYKLSPNDAHYYEDIYCNLVIEDNQEVFILGDNKYLVVERTKDVLLLKKI